MVAKAEEGVKETLRWGERVMGLKVLLKEVAGRVGLEKEDLKGRGRREPVVRGRKVLGQVAVRKLGYTGGRWRGFWG